MVQIAGKYQLVSNEKVVEHFIALGVPEDKAKAIEPLKPTIEVKIDGKKVSIVSDSGIPNSSSTYTLDEEVDEPLPLGYTVKSLAKLNGDTLTVTSKHEGKSKSGTRVYKFSDSGLVLTISSDDPSVPEAKRTYKRV